MRYAITNGIEFWRRVYVAQDGGNWTCFKSKATTWATRSAAESNLIARRSYLSLIGQHNHAAKLRVIELAT